MALDTATQQEAEEKIDLIIAELDQVRAQVATGHIGITTTIRTALVASSQAQALVTFLLGHVGP